MSRLTFLGKTARQLASFFGAHPYYAVAFFTIPLLRLFVGLILGGFRLISLYHLESLWFNVTWDFFALRFCQHFGLFVFFFVLLLAALGRFGRSYGFHKMLWEQPSVAQFFLGYFLACLICSIVLIGFIRDVGGIDEIDVYGMRGICFQEGPDGKADYGSKPTWKIDALRAWTAPLSDDYALILLYYAGAASNITVCVVWLRCLYVLLNANEPAAPNRTGALWAGAIAGTVSVLALILVAAIKPDQKMHLPFGLHLNWLCTVYVLPIGSLALAGFLDWLTRLWAKVKSRVSLDDGLRRIPAVRTLLNHLAKMRRADALRSLGSLFIFLLFLACVSAIPDAWQKSLIDPEAVSQTKNTYADLLARNRLAVPAILICWLCLCSWPKYKMRYHCLRELYRDGKLIHLDRFNQERRQRTFRKQPPEVCPANAPALISKRGTCWRGKRPVAIVCASGGGLRAASWTNAVLMALEEVVSHSPVASEAPLPYSTVLVTGASGGMVGAAYYVSTLVSPTERASILDSSSDKPPEQTFHRAASPASGHDQFPGRRRFFEHVSEDCLGPLMHQMLFGDVPGALWPGTLNRDRGIALEEAWQSNMRGALNAPLRTFFNDELAGWRPSLAFSPMFVESGRRLIISNLDFEEILVTRCNDLSMGQGKKAVQSFTGAEFFRLFGDNGITLATAARMSACFPYFGPAVPLPTQPRRRVVDAGYYDNYGVALAVDWIICNREWLKEHASGVLVIQIRDSKNVADRVLRADGSSRHSSPWDRALQWLTTPLEGLFAAREAVTAFRNDDELEALNDALHIDGEEFFETVTFEFPGEVSLSWALTEDERWQLWEASEVLVHGENAHLGRRMNCKDLKGLHENAMRLQAWWADRVRAEKIDSALPECSI